MNDTSLKRVGMSALRGFVLVLLFFSFLLTVISYLVGGIFFNREHYRAVVQQPKFSESMLGYVREELESECLVYGLPFEIIDESVTEETVSAFSQNYMDAVYDAAFISGTLTKPSVNAAPFKTAITTRLPDIEETIIDELVTEFAAVTTSVLSAGLGQELLKSAHGVLSNEWVVRISQAFPVFLTVTLVLIGIGVVLDLQRIKRQVFAVCAALLTGSMVMFVPVWLIYLYDLPSKLLLGDSPFRLYVVELLNLFIEKFFLVSLWALIITAVLVVAATVWRVWSVQPDESPKKEQTLEKV